MTIYLQNIDDDDEDDVPTPNNIQHFLPILPLSSPSPIETLTNKIDHLQDVITKSIHQQLHQQNEKIQHQLLQQNQQIQENNV